MDLILRPEEPVGPEIGRILRGLCGRLKRMQRDLSSDPHAMIHGVRRTIKQMAAIRRLASKEMPEDWNEQTARLLRVIKNRFARARDQKVLRKQFFALAGPEVSGLCEEVLPTPPSEVARSDVRDLGARISEVSLLVNKAPFWAVTSRGVSFKIRKMLRAHGRRFRRTERRGKAKDFHEWRKSVKDIEAVLVLLRAYGTKKSGLVAECGRLAADLGTANDLANLRRFLSGNGSKTELAPLRKNLEKTLKKLRASCLRAGKRLDSALASYQVPF